MSSSSSNRVNQPEDNKWILDVLPDALAVEVAIRTITRRLGAVGYYLPLAAEKPDCDVEYVHQLRVATRRAVASIKLYWEFFPKNSRERLCRKLKQVRRAAGNARDFDVLVLRHQNAQGSKRAKRFLKVVAKKRRNAQEPLNAIYAASIDSNPLDTYAGKIITAAKKLAKSKKSPRFRCWARDQLRASARAFFDAEPEVLDDLESLHEFRIRGKELRYAMELLAAAFPTSLQTELYPLVEQLQDRLGDINDHAVAVDRFAKWEEKATDRGQKKHLKRLLKSEKKNLHDALWEFARWWTPKRSKRIQRRFRKFVNGKS